MELQFSIIVPVYNRQEEMQELLASLAAQTDHAFEVVVMEGCAEHSCKSVCEQFSEQLDIQYHERATSRSSRRNEGMQLARGNYFLLFDSDCILPPDYIVTVRKALTQHYVDCYGGPDAAGADFTVLQRAVNYAMTSFLTTGGIRGGMKNVNKYLPRAFNMGFSRQVFDKTGGYREMIGEDVDLSMRIKEAGFAVQLIKEAYVYHKRRVTLRSFTRQVTTFGKARVLLSSLHKGSLKLTHLFPTAFLLGNILLLLVGALLSPWFLLPIGLYICLLFVDSLVKNKDLRVALLSPVTAYLQLCGYGWGFLDELFTKRARGQAADALYRA